MKLIKKYKQGNRIIFAKSGAVTKYQENLQKLGLNIGTHGADGSWGNDTQKAFEAGIAKGYINADGSFTSKGLKLIQGSQNTSKQQKQKTSDNSGYTGAWSPTRNSKGIIVADPDTAAQCALWANETLRRSNGGKDFNVTTVGGDAWTRNSSGNAVKIFSGYTSKDVEKSQEAIALYDEFTKLSKKKSKTAADNKRIAQITATLQKMYKDKSIARNKQAADKVQKEFDFNKLDKNKTYSVNMGYSASPNAGIAWMGNWGGTTGTHTGNLYWDPRTSGWRVAHNLNHNGIITDDALSDIVGSGSKKGYYVTDIAYLPTVAATKAARAKGGKANEKEYRNIHWFQNMMNNLFGAYQDEMQAAYNRGYKQTPIYDKKGGKLKTLF